MPYCALSIIDSIIVCTLTKPFYLIAGHRPPGVSRTMPIRTWFSPSISRFDVSLFLLRINGFLWYFIVVYLLHLMLYFNILTKCIASATRTYQIFYATRGGPSASMSAAIFMEETLVQTLV